ncbi:RHS repeat-associated core domain-containing protein [Kribbella antiqua]|uniref:RHS repeat-associated core domain-containing protein n=1 Tax=Kribbella antiqua TaxID=2512217 RepID=UPI001F53E3C8|nr:RHS repeat-associated core domain-containing protein [Kribbella antiqua]
MQKFPRFVAVLVSAALLVSGLEARQPAEAAPAADPKPAAPKVNSRPDVVSASVTARSQGSRVEVESMRTATSTTWANPDGTMTTDAHTAPVRFKAANGAWSPVDLTLAKGTDGAVAPRGHQFGLRLGKRNAAAGQVFASATAGAGRQVEWLAPWKLPEPGLAGTKATYAEIQPGVDLMLDARRSGFEADFVVKQRPATAPVWRIPLRTKGLTARQSKDGAIEFVDAKSIVRSRIPVGQMWDAVKDEHTGMPANAAPVAMSLEKVSAGKATLVLAPDAKWFMDPARVFPVTVDPTYAVTTLLPTFDTWVQSAYPDDLSGTIDLRLGKNGTHTERTFMNFSTAPFAGKDVLSATLSIWQYGAVSCTPSTVYVRAIQPVSTDTRWSNQPTLGTVYGQLTAAKGYTGCPGGRLSIPMTSLAQAWSNASYTVGGLALVAANEADVNSWKRFYASGGPADPYISFTWNRPPSIPDTVQTSEAVAYAAPGESTSSMYSPSLRPWVKTKATDADGNTVKYIYEFYTEPFTVRGTCTSSVYASGTTAGCRPSTDLPDNTLLYIRAKANDGRRDGPWTNYQTRLRTGSQAPAEPVVSCPAPYNVNNSWQDNAPTADVVCTITATGTGYNAPGYIRITVDGKPLATNFTGGAAGQIKITPSSDPAVAKYVVTIPKGTPGLHQITAQAETPAAKLSTVKTHSFGWGGTSLTSPTASPRITTANTVRISASGPPKGSSSSVTARVRWRVSGYGGADDLVGWNEDATVLPVVDNGAGGVTVSTWWDTNNAKIDNNLDSDPDTAGVQPTTLNDRVPVKLDLQVCFTYGTTPQCTWSQTPDTTIQRVPHAFGNGFPTADAGPGQVALWTGEFNTSTTDISVPGYTGDLSISRSHMTYETPTDQINGAFGQGWTAQFDGADAGAAGMQVIDSTKLDGTLVLLDDDGTSLIYESPSGERRTTAAFEQGDWVPVDEDTDQDGSRLTVTGSGSSMVLSYTEDDGTVTTWNPAAAPVANAATFFRAAGISEPGVAGKTAFSYDGNGRVVRILAPAAPGVTCGAYNPSSPLTGMNPGCRALHFIYTTIGATRVRLSEAWLDIYNPDKLPAAGMDSIKVAAYTYDVNALLTKVTDPRSGLATEYTYNAANHLTSVKPAGEVPYQLNYVTVDQREKLDSVTRARPAGDPTGGTATLGKYVYDVPLSGTGLPDLSATSVARWNQKATPTNGFAVFGPDHPLSGAPTSDDWQHADLQYTDAAGYTINTAKYGAGDWQYTSTDYNEQGNAVRELDERALRAVIDASMPAGATVDQLATLTVYNPEIKNAAGDTVLTPAGTLVTDTYGPSRYAALKSGTTAWIRPHARMSYDQGAPNNGINPDTNVPYRLPTTETSYAHDPGTGTDVEVTSQTLTDYGPAIPGDADGWALGQVGKTITDVDLDGTNSSGDIVRLTRHDTEGGVIETRQPASNGADAGTTKTVYYTTAPNATFAECGSKPQWAGLVCKTYPAAAPTGPSGPTSTLPTTTMKAFSYLLAPTSVEEKSGAVTRTTSTTYLPDGRTSSTKITVAGLTGSTPNTEKVTTYDPTTGDPTVVTAKNASGATVSSVTIGYDTWGRQTSYQPSGEQSTTTVYDAAGSVATVTDATGTTRYTYDGADANGKTERRGLITKVEVTTPSATWTSTGAYDADSSMTVQKLPGGVTRYNDIDNAGEPIGLRYTGQVTTVNDDGSTTVDPNGAWLSWSLENDITGRVAHEWTPDGNAFTTTTGGAIPSSRTYSYDNAGRLAQVNDRTATAAGTDLTTVPCVTRTYGFDVNDNRLTKGTAPAASDKSCSTSGATVVTRAFDTADRPVTGANGVGDYAYDALGRTTSVPASDAPHPADGAVTLSYYDNDLAQAITQGGVTTSYLLDASDRRSVETVASGTTTTQTTRHYTDATDNPTWVTTDAGWYRYVELISDDLSLIVEDDGQADLALSNAHGDIVTTVDVPESGVQSSGIQGWSGYEENGSPTQQTILQTGALSYGWLGAKQRAVSGAGLTLMGVRVYNPTTALFLSVDPVRGGGANAYAYPTDPVNKFDLDGRRWWDGIGDSIKSAVRKVGRAGKKAWGHAKSFGKWSWGHAKRFGKFAWKHTKRFGKFAWKHTKRFGKWAWKHTKRFGKWAWKSKRFIGKWALRIGKRAGPVGWGIGCVIGGGNSYWSSGNTGIRRIIDGLVGCVL